MCPRGLPIERYDGPGAEGMYVPEMLFGTLLTGSNFDDSRSLTTGGRNGYGAKLANIFSTEFVVETADSSNGKRFKQTYRPHGQTSTRRPTPRGLGPCSRRVHRT